MEGARPVDGWSDGRHASHVWFSALCSDVAPFRGPLLGAYHLAGCDLGARHERGNRQGAIQKLARRGEGLRQAAHVLGSEIVGDAAADQGTGGASV